MNNSIYSDKVSQNVLTYGLRYADFALQREIFALRAGGVIEVVGEIAYEPSDKEIFHCRMSLEEGLKTDYDIILVCDGSSGPNDKSVPANEFAAQFHEKTNKRQVEILREIVEASDDQIKDREWLGERLYNYGTFPFFKLVKVPQKGVHYSTCGIQQVPDEFVEFCLFLSMLKCENAIEIGVARGGSSYVMAAILYRNNPDMVYRMVDINDSLVHFEEAENIIPSLEKCIPNTSDDFKDEEYDFCFIDADHSYEGIITDWNNVGRYTRKVVAFHDIYAHEYDNENGGTVRGWQEIKEEMKDFEIREFTRFPDKWMGIGTVIKETT